MSGSKVKDFQAERERLNEIVMQYADLSVKRFFSLDSQVYRTGALPAQTKELLGLVASLVLRCDDCIAYHMIRCHDEGVSDEEMVEALDVGFADEGYRGAMRMAAEKLVERSELYDVLATQVATFFAYAGEEQRTLDWLEKAFEERETGLVKLQVDPDWDGVRDDEICHGGAGVRVAVVAVDLPVVQFVWDAASV